MIHKKIAKYWNQNALQWIQAAEAGLDVWRDQLNTQAFLQMLPDVTALSGLDVGCGEGHNSRLIAKCCQQLTAIDIAAQFIAYNHRQPLANLRFKKANASKLPFKQAAFDFAVSTMAFMDMAEWPQAVEEIYRVLKPGGFLQFSITHPCFNECIGQWLSDRSGFVVKNYFQQTEGDIQQWRHFHAPELKPFATPRFLRPLQDWLNILLGVGFALEELREPSATDTAIANYPALASTRIAAHSLIIRVRK